VFTSAFLLEINLHVATPVDPKSELRMHYLSKESKPGDEHVYLIDRFSGDVEPMTHEATQQLW
jgi:hypothetical protein